MPVTVEFTETVSQAVDQAEGQASAKGQRKHMERWFNRGLKELADGGSEPARALYDSDQTIRLVCKDEDEGRQLLEKHQVTFPEKESYLAGAGPAITIGDFDEQGNPRQGGTAKIIIDNAIIARNTFFDEINTLEGSVTYFQWLIHELLHAANRKYVHKIGGGMEVYERWVEDFKAVLERIYGVRTSLLPGFLKNPVVMLAGILAVLLVAFSLFLLSGANILSIFKPGDRSAVQATTLPVSAQNTPTAQPTSASEMDVPLNVFAVTLGGNYEHHEGFSNVVGNVLVYEENGAPVQDAGVTMTLLQPDGSSVTSATTTSPLGLAELSFTIYTYGGYTLVLENIEGENLVYSPEWNIANSVQIDVTGSPGAPIMAYDRLSRFYNEYNQAFLNRDIDFLFENLHPAVIERYSGEVCYSYLVSVLNSPVEVTIDSLLDFGAWDWVVDDQVAHIEDAYALDVSILLPDGSSSQQQVHLALSDGQSIRWFAVCASSTP